MIVKDKLSDKFSDHEIDMFMRNIMHDARGRLRKSNRSIRKFNRRRPQAMSGEDIILVLENNKFLANKYDYETTNRALSEAVRIIRDYSRMKTEYDNLVKNKDDDELEEEKCCRVELQQLYDSKKNPVDSWFICGETKEPIAYETEEFGRMIKYCPYCGKRIILP